MTREEMHNAVGERLYIEDYGMIDITLASVVANKMRLGDPVWLLLIGASSGGKSQIIRPIAMADEGTHRVDDLTENTLISGICPKGKTEKEQKENDPSILFKVGEHGILSISDLTVIFSKNTETRNAILSQLRMVFDGEFTKFFGNQKSKTWKGYLGMLAGCTPSAYRFFAEVSDMGERFVYYRMKEPDYQKASEWVLNNIRSSTELDIELRDVYGEYLKTVLRSGITCDILPEKTKRVINDTALAGTRFRTPVHLDRQDNVDEYPVQEAPYRVIKQLTNIARALHIMHKVDTGEDELPPSLLNHLRYCAYSLASDTRRHIYGAVLEEVSATITGMTERTGMHETVIRRYLSELTAIGVLTRDNTNTEGNAHVWRNADYNLRDLVEAFLIIEEKKPQAVLQETPVDITNW